MEAYGVFRSPLFGRPLKPLSPPVATIWGARFGVLDMFKYEG